MNSAKKKAGKKRSRHGLGAARMGFRWAPQKPSEGPPREGKIPSRGHPTPRIFPPRFIRRGIKWGNGAARAFGNGGKAAIHDFIYKIEK